MIVLGMFGVVQTGYAQGTVLLSNLGGGVNAPVLYGDIAAGRGPGPDFTAQLLLVNANNALTPLLPTTTFRPPGTTPQTAIADRYLETRTVEVPGVAPGTRATFIVRAWRTSCKRFLFLRNRF